MSQRLTTFVCVLDLGTTAIKAALVDERGGFVALRGCPAVAMDPGLGTFDAERYGELVLELLRQLAGEAAGSIAGISMCSQRATAVALREDLTPAGPAWSWLSTRCAAGAEPVFQGLGINRFREITGLFPSPIYTIAKLAAGDLPRGGGVCAYADLQAFLLHGLGAPELVVDPSNASALGLAELGHPVWSGELCDAVGISPSSLPRILPAGTAVGGLSPDAAAATGIPAGTPLVLGGGDQQTSVLGAGALEEGSLSLGLGTSAALGGPVFEVPSPPPDGLLAGHHVVPGAWLVEGFIPSFGASADWAAEALGMEGVEELERHAAAVRDRGGVVFVPSLAGSGSPDFDGSIRAGWLGMSQGAGRDRLARSVLEGLACELERVARCFVAGRPLGVLRATGGGTRGDLLMRLVAETLQADLEISEVRDTGLLGAAAVAWAGLGRYEDISAAALAMGAAQGRTVAVTEDPGRSDRVARYAAALAAVTGFARGEE